MTKRPWHVNAIKDGRIIEEAEGCKKCDAMLEVLQAIAYHLAVYLEIELGEAASKRPRRSTCATCGPQRGGRHADHAVRHT